MNLKAYIPSDLFNRSNPKNIPTEIVNSEIAKAELRLEAWRCKGYYEKIVSLAKIVDQMPANTDHLSMLIRSEIDDLVAQSQKAIACI